MNEENGFFRFEGGWVGACMCFEKRYTSLHNHFFQDTEHMQLLLRSCTQR